MKKVVITPHERIEDFERTAVEFFRAVLGVDYSDCIVTDESCLNAAGFWRAEQEINAEVKYAMAPLP